MSTLTTTTKFVAIAPIVFTKIESKVEGGFARIAQKVDIIAVPLVLGHIEAVGLTSIYHDPKSTKVLVMGDSGLAPWNKAVLDYNGVKFVKCPLTEILGFEEDVKEESFESVVEETLGETTYKVTQR